MAELTVRYFGVLHELAGKRVEKVKVKDDSTLATLLRSIAQTHGAKFKAFLFSQEGKLNKSLAFAADGDSVPSSELKNTKCVEVKEFAILPPISGGFKSRILK